MSLYDIKNSKIHEIEEIGFKLEKDLQNLIEKNLPNIFGLTFIKTEMQIKDLRIDTLAYDKENNSFVIIEYKRDKNYSVVDQGMSYLSLMLNYKADFVLSYNETGLGTLRIGDIDWSQSKVLFIAQSFSKYQRNAINFKNLPIELWEVKRYKNQTLSISKIKTDPNSESFTKITTHSEEYKEVSRQVKQYEVDDHLKNANAEAKKLYEELIEKVTALDDRIEINPVKQYIGLVIGSKNIGGVQIRKNYIRLSLGRTKPEDLTDTKGKLKYRATSMKHHNQHISDMNIENESDVNYAVLLVRELLEKQFNS